ncbi:MAG: DUF3863 domain-containing protein [Draconibacterium sp.]|nr:DUF3863 domain-containing protein [Draconibacterium sp.]
MDRRNFIKKTTATSAGLTLSPYFTGAFTKNSNKIASLMGGRFVTFCIMIRVTPWEVSRDVKLLPDDESPYHTLEVVRDMREAFAENNPEGRLTWGFTLNALEDKRSNYRDIRKYVKECYEKYGDEVSYFPGYFPAMYLPRERVNKEMSEAIEIISDFVGNGYRPQSIMGGFLAADSLKYLAEKEDIHVAHATIWSQHAVDGGGADGSPSYPFYPSTEHFCKPAQGKSDFIDCVNLDGWSVDFLSAIHSGGFNGTTPFNGISSRRGVGPIETYCDLGPEIGHLSVMFTQSLHFDSGFELNGFGFVPNIWEAILVKQPARKDWGDQYILDMLKKWVGETKKRWEDVQFITFGEFGEIWRNHYTNNDKWNYRFEEKGLGIANSYPDKEIKWFMNKNFRLALLRNWHRNTPEKVIDFTRYDIPANEPHGATPENPKKDWSLMNVMNQKRLRPQDKPLPLHELREEDKLLIAKYYPELF